MAKRIIIITGIIVLMILCAFGLKIWVKHSKAQYEVEELQYEKSQKNKEVLLALGVCDGSALNCDDIAKEEITLDDNELMIRVAYYNAINNLSEENAFTVDSIKNDFEEYRKGNPNVLDDYIEVINSDNENAPNKNMRSVTYKTFSYDTNRSLRYLYGKDASSTNASTDQIKAALEITVENYHSGKWTDPADANMDLQEKIEKDRMEKDAIREATDPKKDE